MKKIILILVCLTLILSVCFAFSACNGETVAPLDFSRFRTDEFKNYTDMYLNENMSSLTVEGKKQGLFLVTGYDGGTVDYKGRPVPDEVSVNDAEAVASNFDPDKPTIVIIHGVQPSEGRYSNAYFWGDNHMGYDVELSELFYDPSQNFENRGWNVLYFHYEQFVEAEGNGKDADLMGNAVIEVNKAIWTMGENGIGSRIIEVDENNQGTWSQEAAFDGSICEYFAAEYLRFMNNVTTAFEDYLTQRDEIRFVCHSMGGVTTVSSVTLLTAMAEAGEIDKAYLPDRLALIDPYVGIYGDQTLKIAWSGKSIENFRETYLLGIQYYKKISGGVVEFYVNSEVGVVPYMVIGSEGSLEKELMTECAYSVVIPQYRNVSIVFSGGHNAMREWYFYSYTTQPVRLYNEEDAQLVNREYVLREGAIPIGYSPSASLSTEDLKKIVGQPVIQKVDTSSGKDIGVLPYITYPTGLTVTEHIFVPYNKYAI